MRFLNNKNILKCGTLIKISKIMKFANKTRFDNTEVWHTSETCGLASAICLLAVTKGFCPCNTMGLAAVEETCRQSLNN